MAHVFSEPMKALILNVTGFTVQQLQAKPVEEVQEALRNRLGRPLRYRREPLQTVRGSMLLELGRTISAEEIEARLPKV